VGNANRVASKTKLTKSCKISTSGLWGIISAKSVAGLFSVLMVVTVSTSITEKTKFEQVPLVVTENNQRGLLEVVLVGCASYAS